MKNSLIPVYLMPGMAANSSIFDGIKLSKDQFKVFKLDWHLPDKGISLEDYAKQMCEQITEENPVLIGVSFGGLLVQEMAKFIPTRKLIVVSCVKSYTELPKKMVFAKYTKVHKLLPTGLVSNIELLAKYAFGETITKRIDLYEKYLSIRDKYYIDWSINHIVNWKQETPLENLIHIHGEKDTVFPISNISDCIRIKNGTHAMIIYRAKWFNEHLPRLIFK